MKGLWFTILCLAGVLMFSACGDDDDSNGNNGSQGDLNAYEDLLQNPQVVAEENEIKSGKLFTIESGSVTYNDGTVLSFVDYGKKYRMDLESESSSLIWDGSCLYTLYHNNQTYTATNGTSVLTLALSAVRTYVFNEVLWELSYKQALKYESYRPEDVLVKTETIAGKSVKLYGDRDEEGNPQFTGGWSRILVYQDGGDASGSDALVAVSIKESYSGSFTVPSDYSPALEFGL